MSFASDGRRIGTSGDNGRAWVWSTDDGHEMLGLRHGGRATVVWDVLFSPDRTRIVTVGGHSARLWSAAGAPVMEIGTRAWAGDVLAAALSSDGTMLAAGCWDGRGRVFDLGDGREVLRVQHGRGLKRNQIAVDAVAFSPDDALIAIGALDKRVTVWARAGGDSLLSVRAGSPVHAVAVSPDGSTLAIGCRDGSIRLVLLRDGHERLRIAAHRKPINALAYAPDGRHIASAGFDGLVRISRVDDGGEALRIVSGQAMHGVRYNEAGSQFATAGADRTARVWSVAELLDR